MEVRVLPLLLNSLLTFRFSFVLEAFLFKLLVSTSVLKTKELFSFSFCITLNIFISLRASVPFVHYLLSYAYGFFFLFLFTERLLKLFNRHEGLLQREVIGNLVGS